VDDPEGCVVVEGLGEGLVEALVLRVASVDPGGVDAGAVAAVDPVSLGPIVGVDPEHAVATPSAMTTPRRTRARSGRLTY